MGKKLDCEFVKNEFTKNNCILLDEYKNAQSLMSYICSCGNTSKICWQSFKNGHRCKKCGDIKNTHNKFSYEYVSEFFKTNNCVLLTKTYEKVYSKLDFICSCGNQGCRSFQSFTQGRRCNICSKAKKQSRKFDYDFVKSFYESQSCKLLEDKYVSARHPMNYQCVCGNISKTAFWAFKSGRRCVNCQINNMKGEKSAFWNPDRKFIEDSKKIRKKLYSMLQRTLNCTKSSKTEELLGYTPKDLKNHIENHKNWSLIKNNEWHLDHIFPIIAFIKYKIFDPKIINNLDNLQPLQNKENLSKGDKYCEIEFEQYLENKGIKIEKL
jgi:plasmid maintenance system killer protein